MAVTWSVGALAWRFACVSFSGGPRGVLSYIHTLLRLRRRARTLAALPYLALFVLACVGTPLALLVPFGLWYVCFVVVVRSPVACGSLLSFTCGCPSYHTSFRVDGLESICGWSGGGLVLVAVICSAVGTLVCGGSLVPLPSLAPLDYTLLCLRRFIQRACMGIPLGRLAPAGALACVLWCGVPFVFFRVALWVWGPPSPCCFHTPCLPHGVRVLCVRGMCGRALLLVAARLLFCFPRALRATAPFLP